VLLDESVSMGRYLWNIRTAPIISARAIKTARLL